MVALVERLREPAIRLRVPLLPCCTRKLTYCPTVRLSVTDALLPIQILAEVAPEDTPPSPRQVSPT